MRRAVSTWPWLPRLAILISRKCSAWSIRAQAFSSVPDSSEARCERSARAVARRASLTALFAAWTSVSSTSGSGADGCACRRAMRPSTKGSDERPGEGGLDVGHQRVVALEHQRSAGVEGEVRAATGVDAALVLLGEAGEQRLGLELVGGELALPGQPEDLGRRERGIGLAEQLEGDLGDGRVLALLAPLLLLVATAALLPARAAHVVAPRLGVALDRPEGREVLLGVLVRSGHRLQRGGVLGHAPGGEGEGVGSGDGDLPVAGAPGHRRQTREHRLFRRLPDVAEEALGDRPLGDSRPS